MRTPPRILVVDDDPTNVEVLRVRLSAQGYEVVTAADGDEALQRARTLEPDLVLLDVMMPKLDGISVLKELKADITPRFVPIILVTAKAETRDIDGGLEAGGDGYITKPFEQAALVARVRSLLRIKELHDTAQLQAVQLKQQTDELSSWNRLLEERVAEQLAQVDKDRPFAAIFGSASGADDCFLERTRLAFGEPSAGGDGVVLRSARIHCLHRGVRAGRGYGVPAGISRELGGAYLPI